MNELRVKPDFECVYSEFKEKVARYVRGKIFNEHESEDVVSDVFVKVFDGLSAFNENKSSLSTWIYTITRNTVTDYFRSSRSFCEIPEELCAQDDTEQSLLTEETLNSLADALSGLSERERDIIVLHYYSDKTLKDIAQMMSISYSYVKLLHSGALEKLRKTINE